MKAQKLPSGNYRVRVTATIDGKKNTRSFTSPNKTEAMQKAIEWKQSKKANYNTMTVGEAIDKYISIKENVLSPSTVRGYKTIRKNCITDIEDIKVNKITQVRYQQFISDLSAKYSAKTVHNANGLIRSSITLISPYTDLGKITLPQKERALKQPLNGNEIGELVNAIKGHRNEIPLLLALYLGLRQSEILALQYEDIDTKKDLVYIHRACVPNSESQYITKDFPKNDSSNRILHLPKYIKSRLPEDREGNVYKFSPTLLGKDLTRITQQIGITKVTLHELRHTMATLGVTLNISDKVMMSRGGWSNPQTMKNIYQHILSEDEITASTIIEQYIDSKVDTKIDTDRK